ncbi:odorant receptor Or2 isoform X1 [Fopius arisanus]|uniref:Odorant receptor n=2 Tax=Fopius arisanus TaxID=64838 RepID=A0A9R1T145_9HYME|nr:PREDICTED: odorant receptor Or2-like isoform X1 [Fopius arisanus]
MVYTLINAFTNAIVTAKFVTFMIRRDDYVKLLQLSCDSLWRPDATGDEAPVLKQCEKQAKFCVIFFAIFAQITGWVYITEPIIINLLNNSTDPKDRVFPFDVWLEVPVYETPFFEILFFIQSAMTYHVCILYCCFDNYLAIANIFIAGHFTILRNRLTALYNREVNGSKGNHDRNRNDLNLVFSEFKGCVRQHQFLIRVVEQVESVYTLMNLASVLIYSIIICLIGYQLIMPGNTVLRRIKFTGFVSTCLSQLLSFAFTCNNVSLASVDVSAGPYNSDWYATDCSKLGRMLRKDFIIIMLRSQRPCYLTGAGFFPVTLNTLKSVLSTALSYLTLIRQRSMQQ